jgi:cell division protein FtsB
MPVGVLNGMIKAGTTRRKSKLLGVIGRWSEQGSLSWRKVATVAASALALSLGYHVMFGQNGLTSYEQKRVEARALGRQLQSLQRENEALKSHVDSLQSDPNAIEHQAREELHYTRPGEVIYTLPEPTVDAKKPGVRR